MLALYRLPNKIEGEEIVKVIRRDFFAMFMKIIFFLLLSIIPLGFLAIIGLVDPNFLVITEYGPLIVLALSAYYLFVWLFFFFSFIDYYLDIWIISSERIIDIQQRGFFSRVISEQKLYRIQDVTSEVHGFIPTMLKFGNVHVQTAGTKERFFFHEVPHPDEVRNTIIRLVRLNKRKHEKEVATGNFTEGEESEIVEEVMKH